jgi:hypothetical protein
LEGGWNMALHYAMHMFLLIYSRQLVFTGSAPVICVAVIRNRLLLSGCASYTYQCLTRVVKPDSLPQELASSPTAEILTQFTLKFVLTRVTGVNN